MATPSVSGQFPVRTQLGQGWRGLGFAGIAVTEAPQYVRLSPVQTRAAGAGTAPSGARRAPPAPLHTRDRHAWETRATKAQGERGRHCRLHRLLRARPEPRSPRTPRVARAGSRWVCGRDSGEAGEVSELPSAALSIARRLSSLCRREQGGETAAPGTRGSRNGAWMWGAVPVPLPGHAW